MSDTKRTGLLAELVQEAQAVDVESLPIAGKAPSTEVSVTPPSVNPGDSIPETSTSDASEPARSEAEKREHRLYYVAHRAHFVQRNPALALAAWDAYLRIAPRGTFAMESQYNRAICLVRLGRVAEANAALTPFAEGAYGGYRQREAEVLLSGLPE